MASHPILELQEILSRTTVFEGTVVSRGQTFNVRTTAGVVVAENPSNFRLQVGDRVRLEGGVITARLRDQDSLPTFDL